MTFGFFKDADSNVAPPSYPGTAVGAGDETLIGRIVWNDEFIAAALRASEWGVRHGACRPFWSALANLVSLGRTIMRPNGRKSSPVLKPRGAWLLLVRWLGCRAGQGAAGPRRYAMKTWDKASLGPLLRRRGHKTERLTATGDCSGNTIPTQISTILSHEVFCVLVVLCGEYSARR